MRWTTSHWNWNWNYAWFTNIQIKVPTETSLERRGLSSVKVSHFLPYCVSDKFFEFSTNNFHVHVCLRKKLVHVTWTSRPAPETCSLTRFLVDFSCTCFLHWIDSRIPCKKLAGKLAGTWPILRGLTGRLCLLWMLLVQELTSKSDTRKLHKKTCTGFLSVCYQHYKNNWLLISMSPPTTSVAEALCFRVKLEKSSTDRLTSQEYWIRIAIKI